MAIKTLFHPGDRFSHFLIQKLISKGGMGEVYLAVDQNNDSEVALKVIADQKTLTEEDKKRFFKEATFLSRLNHPLVVSIYEYDCFEDINYISMEYIKGKTLKESYQEKPYGIREALKIFIQLFEVLSKMHGEKILHRDIKPDNIICKDDGSIKVIDFGIAKLDQSDETNLTSTGLVVGTVTYLAPEVIKGQKASEASDLWATGVIFYEMFTGKNPFKADNQVTSIEYIRNKTVEFPNDIQRYVPPKLQDFILSLLSKEPFQRPRSANECISFIRDFVKNEQIPETVDPVTDKIKIKNAELIHQQLEKRGISKYLSRLIILYSLGFEVKGKDLGSENEVEVTKKSLDLGLSHLLKYKIRSVKTEKININDSTNINHTFSFKIKALVTFLSLLIFVGGIIFILNLGKIDLNSYDPVPGDVFIFRDRNKTNRMEILAKNKNYMLMNTSITPIWLYSNPLFINNAFGVNNSGSSIDADGHIKTKFKDIPEIKVGSEFSSRLTSMAIESSFISNRHCYISEKQKIVLKLGESDTYKVHCGDQPINKENYLEKTLETYLYSENLRIGVKYEFNLTDSSGKRSVNQVELLDIEKSSDRKVNYVEIKELNEDSIKKINIKNDLKLVDGEKSRRLYSDQENRRFWINEKGHVWYEDSFPYFGIRGWINIFEQEFFIEDPQLRDDEENDRFRPKNRRQLIVKGSQPNSKYIHYRYCDFQSKRFHKIKIGKILAVYGFCKTQDQSGKIVSEREFLLQEDWNIIVKEVKTFHKKDGSFKVSTFELEKIMVPE